MAIEKATNGIGARISRDVGLIVPNGVMTAVPFNIEIFDTSNFHTSGSQLVIPSTGIYVVNVDLEWQANNTGFRWLFVKKNGTDIIGANLTNAANGFSTYQSKSLIYLFTAGDYIECIVQQTSGNDLLLVHQSNGNEFILPIFSIVKT